MQGCIDGQLTRFVPYDSIYSQQVLPNESQKKWLTSILAPVATLVLSLFLFPQTNLAEEARSKRLLQQPTEVELLQTRTKIEMELDGELRVDDRGSKQSGGISNVPVKAKATHDYFETIVFQESRQKVSAREYIKAELENWVKGNSHAQSLRPSCSRTRCMDHEGTWEQFCPEQPLDQKEVELLRTPINTAMLERILPIQPAKANSKWAVSDEDARLLLNLEAVHKSDLRAQIASVERGMAKIELQGKLQATADSVPTEIHIRGSAHVEMSSQGAIVKWLGISIKETRDISQYHPGFDITARIQLIRQEQVDKKLASREELLSLVATDDSSRWLVRHESEKGGYTMFAGRNWITYLDGTEDSVLRMIENNQSIAQCNLAQLPKLDAGTQLTAEGLEADVRAALKERLGEVIESTEKVTTANLRLLRLEVSGTQEQIPIHWIYAHLSNDTGRRLALVFTLAADQAETFAGSDLQILDSLQFIETLRDEDSDAAPSSPQSARVASPTKR